VKEARKLAKMLRLVLNCKLTKDKELRYKYDAKGHFGRDCQVLSNPGLGIQKDVIIFI
jgi:hypothetical protein